MGWETLNKEQCWDLTQVCKKTPHLYGTWDTEEQCGPPSFPLATSTALGFVGREADPGEHSPDVLGLLMNQGETWLTCWWSGYSQWILASAGAQFPILGLFWLVETGLSWLGTEWG